MTDKYEMVREQEYRPEVVEWLTKIANAVNEIGTSITVDGMTYDLGDLEVLYDGENIGIGIGGSEFSADTHAIITYHYRKVEE